MYINKEENNIILLKNIKIYSILMFLWILSSAQQCTSTDSCGTYNYNVDTIKASLVITGTIPNNVYTPILQNINNIPNSINIQGSLWNNEPTIFGIKVESYATCNGIPRFSSICCITKENNQCLTLNDESINQVTVGYKSAYKCKVTIRAISKYSFSGLHRLGSYIDMYEGGFDIDPTSTTPPTNTICNLVFTRRYSQDNNTYTVQDKVCAFTQ
jgi:hypothetical protein